MSLNVYGSYKSETEARTRYIMIYGPSDWARGKTEAEALKNYKKMTKGMRSHEVIVFDIDWESSVNTLGQMMRVRGALPEKELKRITV